MKLQYIKRILLAVCGIMIYAFGVVLTIKANVGLAPWDVFFIAVSGKLGVSYGTVAIPANILILGGALLLREKIGVATVLDTVLSGLFVDFFTLTLDFENPTSYVARYALLFAGMIVMSLAIFIYMNAAIGCGPKDSLMVGVGKRLKKIPVGFARVFIDATILAIGFIIDPTLAGVGTAVVAFGFGLIMVAVFALIKFEPKRIVHENIITSFKNFFSGKDKKRTQNTKN